MSKIRRTSYTKNLTYKGHHATQHWYVDNQIYFITARCRDRFSAMRGEEAKSIFWNRVDHYAACYGFTPIVTSVLDNHYHTLGHLQVGTDLGPLMQKLHGSVAKLVSDTLDVRRVPFWHDRRHHDYFDGCLRDEKQFRLTYRYICIQSERHGHARDWRDYPHRRVARGCEEALARAVELNALLRGVDYKRYRDGQQAR